MYKQNDEQTLSIQTNLKMLGLYLFTLIIGHKFCNTLSILNKLINIVKGIAIFCDKLCVFGQKSKNTTTNNTKNQT